MFRILACIIFYLESYVNKILDYVIYENRFILFIIISILTKLFLFITEYIFTKLFGYMYMCIFKKTFRYIY